MIKALPVPSSWLVVQVTHFLNDPPKGASFSYSHKAVLCAGNSPDFPTLVLLGKYCQEKFLSLPESSLTFCMHIQVLRGPLADHPALRRALSYTQVLGFQVCLLTFNAKNTLFMLSTFLLILCVIVKSLIIVRSRWGSQNVFFCSQMIILRQCMFSMYMH